MNQPAFDQAKVTEIKLAEDCGCNVANDQLVAQVRFNIMRGLPQAMPYEPNTETALLVCGGPSLAETEHELVEAYWAGGKVIAANGAYQWCIDRNIRPSAVVMLDAREFNSRFVEAAVPDCRYLLASQCHPATFDICRGRDVTIWHAIGSGSEAEIEVLKDYYFGRFHAVTLGTTIGIRALSLLRMLGFLKIDIYGLDSCWLDDRHHSYAQPENDRDMRIPVWLGAQGHDNIAKRFVCSPWHIKQAHDFKDLVKDRGEMFQVNVRGPGLIATMLRTGAELPDVAMQED